MKYTKLLVIMMIMLLVSAGFAFVGEGAYYGGSGFPGNLFGNQNQGQDGFRRPQIDIGHLYDGVLIGGEPLGDPRRRGPGPEYQPTQFGPDDPTQPNGYDYAM